jgi:hypothetical protein
MRAAPAQDAAEGPEAVWCDHCGLIVGVFEPLIVADHGRVRETSRADEDGLPLVDVTYYHRDCYQRL